MVLKFRLFLSYLFFAVFIIALSVFFLSEIEHNTDDSLLYYILIFSISIFLSTFLASFFSKSIISLSDRLKESNRKLDNEIKQRTEELDKSLKIIDKYVIRSSTDPDGIITDVSKAFCDISGYSKIELIGQPHSIVRHPNMSDEIFKDMWTTIASGKTWNGIIENKAKDGSSYWVKAFIEPEFDREGNIEGYTAIRHNITSEILLESQMKKNSAIISFANSAIGTMDFQGNFLSVNGVYSKIFGYTKDEFYGKNCLEMTAPEDKENVSAILKEAQEMGIVSHVEKVCLDKFGNKVHVDMSLNKLPDEKTLVVVVNSLEDKKKLEKINSSLTKQVEQEVQKNILQMEAIQKEQLKHAKLSSIGLIASGIIHEINTPLTYIKGNLEMFMYDIEDLPTCTIKNNTKENVQQIYSGIRRIENIVKSMQEVSGISSETKNIENVYETLIMSLNILSNTAKNISKIFLNGKLFQIGMDSNEFKYLSSIQKQRLEQVWIIIINNALDELVKIKDYEKRKLDIDIYATDQNIIVKFHDNAGGISPKIITNLFEPLISTKQSGGIGIGLNIAKKIIREQNGDISAYNQNNGAVFEVILPIVKES